MAQQEVRTHADRLEIGHLSVTFHRTLRIPDDGKNYPLPPSLGAFPIRKVSDYADRVPDDWREHGGVFIPMYQREALWMSFHSVTGKYGAVKVGIGKIDALTGKKWSEKLHARRQDYMVVPGQPWLDGINAGKEFIKQFVAMPLGMGYTVEGQLTGKEDVGGIQFKVFPAKPGREPEPPVFLHHDQLAPASAKHEYSMPAAQSAAPAMGLGAGGKMTQSIYPDPHGIDIWDQERSGRCFVHIANSMVWRDITGEEPPATPVSAELYTQYGFPWFELYDEDKGDIGASGKLGGVKTVKEMDKEKGFGTQQDDSTVDIDPNQIKNADPTKVLDGKW